MLKPGVLIVVTIAAYACNNASKRILKLSVHQFQIFFVRDQYLTSLHLYGYQAIWERINKHVRKHVLAIFTTYTDTRLWTFSRHKIVAVLQCCSVALLHCCKEEDLCLVSIWVVMIDIANTWLGTCILRCTDTGCSPYRWNDRMFWYFTRNNSDSFKIFFQASSQDVWQSLQLYGDQALILVSTKS